MRPVPVPNAAAHRRSWTVLPAALLLFALLLAPMAHAGIADAPGRELQVSLITYGPGAIYWERFGHDAIEIRDTASGQTVNFNYGVFDFDQKNFLLNFARGKMNYMMDAERAAPEIAWYVDQGRSVRRQTLALASGQRARLRDFLLWNLRPENLHYRYDYYTNNCTTKVRDALDRVLDGRLHRQLAARSAPLTYRQQTDRVMARQPGLMLLLDLGLSGYADQPLNAWQGSFLPSVLSREVGHVQIPDGHGGTRALVASTTLLAAQKITPPPAQPPDLRLPLLLAGAAIAGVLLVSARYRHRAAQLTFGIVSSVWLVFAGVAGLFMLALWTLTTHHAGWANANLLLFNPLALGLLAAVWRTRIPRRAHLLAWTVTVVAVAALACNLTGLLAQRNLPWILLALPVWLALLRTLRQRTTA